MRPRPYHAPPPQSKPQQPDPPAGTPVKAWQPSIQPTDEEIDRNLQPLEDLAAGSQPSSPPESTIVEQGGEVELSAEELQGIIAEDKAEQPADKPKAIEAAAQSDQKKEEPSLFDLDKPVIILDSSAVDGTKEGKDECLAKLNAVYGKTAVEGFAQADLDLLRDAVTMLVQGEWIMDTVRLHKMLHVAIPAFDPGHFNQDIRNVDNTRVLVRSIVGALTRNFDKSDQVKTIAKKLQDTNPFIRSDSKSSSGASPLPGTPSTLIASPKKRR